MSEKKTALVTGGSKGIGHGIVRALANSGYDVCFTYLNSEDRAKELKDFVTQKYGVRCECFQASLQDRDVPKKLINDTVNFLGSLSVLVNNAGLTVFRSILEMLPEEMDSLIDLDFRGYILTSMYTARYMVENHIQGNIVNITSTRGERAYPRDSVYGGVKAGIERASKSMALDLAPYGIRVNCVAPGATQVREGNPFYEYLGKRIPLGRMGTVEDVANAVCWLISAEASYVTGASIKVDGGLTLPGMPESKPKGDNDLGWGFVSKQG